MLTRKEQDIIKQCAVKYKVSAVILFGSSIVRDKQAKDIDLAVKGIKPELFFKFYGELFKNLSKPVDLIDLSGKSLFNKLVQEKGVKIYG